MMPTLSSLAAPEILLWQFMEAPKVGIMTTLVFQCEANVVIFIVVFYSISGDAHKKVYYNYDGNNGNG